MKVSNEKWNIDKVLLNPGGVVDILNRFGDRERELLQKISDLTDELREIKRTHIKLDPPSGILQFGEPMYVKKSVEDYAVAALIGLLAFPGELYGKMSASSSKYAEMSFDMAEVMVAERDKRGGGNG